MGELQRRALSSMDENRAPQVVAVGKQAVGLVGDLERVQRKNKRLQQQVESQKLVIRELKEKVAASSPKKRRTRSPERDGMHVEEEMGHEYEAMTQEVTSLKQKIAFTEQKLQETTYRYEASQGYLQQAMSLAKDQQQDIEDMESKLGRLDALESHVVELDMVNRALREEATDSSAVDAVREMSNVKLCRMQENLKMALSKAVAKIAAYKATITALTQEKETLKQELMHQQEINIQLAKGVLEHH